MNDPTGDNLVRWTRQVEKLKLQRSKLRPDTDATRRELTESLLSACDSLLQELGGAEMAANGLRARITTETDVWNHLFSALPIPCVVTNRHGNILQANKAAGSFLNVSSTHLPDRQLLLFTENRVAFSNILQCLPAHEDRFRITLMFRPKERRRSQVDVTVVPLSAERDDAWLWFLNPIQEVHDSVPPSGLPGSGHEEKQRSSPQKA